MQLTWGADVIPLAAPAETGVAGSGAALGELCASIEVAIADEAGSSIDEASTVTVPGHPTPGTAIS